MFKMLKKALKLLGPGVITGASDDDPSGIATYSMAGASLGYATLWTALLSFPLMASVQFICAKIGLVSGMGLAGAVCGGVGCGGMVNPGLGASLGGIPPGARRGTARS